MAINYNVKRVLASLDGIGVMMLVFVTLVAGMSYFKIYHYELNSILQIILFPGTFVTGITSGEEILVGLPIEPLFASLVIYMVVGFVYDYYHKPKI